MARTGLIPPDEISEKYRDLFSEDYAPLLKSLFTSTEEMTKHFTSREEELIDLPTHHSHYRHRKHHHHKQEEHDDNESLWYLLDIVDSCFGAIWRQL
jgi:hypothetical protein